MRILYTGFSPFGGESINPSFEALKLLPEKIAGAEVVIREIPTEFGRGPEAVLKAVKELSPDAVICVGQAGGRASVTPEYIGINCRNARIPDNAGQKPEFERIRPEGPDGIFSRLPVALIAEKCREKGIPAAVSYSAGTYVCNDVLYTLLYETDPGLPAGFIHVPYACSQTAAQPNPAASLPLETIAEALRIAGETVLEML